MMKMNQAENIVSYFWDKDRMKKCWASLEPGYVPRHVYYIPIGTVYEDPDATEGDAKKDEEAKTEEPEEVVEEEEEEPEDEDDKDEEVKAEEVKGGTENKEKKKVFAKEFTE
jgi:Ca2+-dependent lipid-binding protein